MYKFSVPCLETTLDIAKYSLIVTGQCVESVKNRRVLVFQCRFEKEDFNACTSCGVVVKSRGTLARTVVHMPVGVRPVRLLLRLRQYVCATCETYWSERPGSLLAFERSLLSVDAIRWALIQVVFNKISISAAASSLLVSWNTVNTAVLDAGYRELISDPSRFDTVNTIGVDEHCWRHTGWRSERFVTIIVDLTPRPAGKPARLLDMIPGRSKKVLKTWLKNQTSAFRAGVKVVAMDGFTGYKTAAIEALGHRVVTVMDPFHVVHLAAEKLNKCRQRLQQETLGRRGAKNDPLYKTRRLLLTRTKLLNDESWDNVQKIITDEKYGDIMKIWGIYQKMIQAYQDEDQSKGKQIMTTLIDALTLEATRHIPELKTLRKTLKKRRTDILAYFNHPNSSNGPTEAINGRLEHLRGIALGFKNLHNYIQRSLLHTGTFQTKLQPYL